VGRAFQVRLQQRRDRRQLVQLALQQRLELYPEQQRVELLAQQQRLQQQRLEQQHAEQQRVQQQLAQQQRVEQQLPQQQRQLGYGEVGPSRTSSGPFPKGSGPFFCRNCRTREK
jgi:hypothetical protein